MSNSIILTSTQGNVQPILNKNGKVIRNEIKFGEHGNGASAIRKKLRETTALKGKELTARVTQILAGEKDLRNVIAREALNKALEDGVCDSISETSNMLTLKVQKPKVTKQAVIDTQAEQIARIMSVLTPEQKKALSAS
jgi:hypothetical protein